MTIGYVRIVANQLSTRCERCYFRADAFAADYRDLDHVGKTFTPISSQNESMVAADRPPERRGFAVALQVSGNLQDAKASRAGGADRSQNKRAPVPLGEVIVCFLETTPMRPAPWVSSISGSEASTMRLVDDDRETPFLKAIGEEKMSPKLDPMTARIPISCSDQTAPFAGGTTTKIGPVTRNFGLPIGLAIQNESGFSEPSARYRSDRMPIYRACREWHFRPRRSMRMMTSVSDVAAA